MGMAEPFTLTSQTVGCLPVLNHFLTRIGLSRLLASYLPTDDARLRLAPAAVIGVAVANIVVRHRPVYALAEWAAHYDPALLGLSGGDADALNDDRVGRMLDRLFDADRASLVTETILGVVREFDVDLTQLHNDSTTITVSADGAVPIAYRVADGNTVDDPTHIPTWDELRALVGNPGFLYVADSKLCSKEAMGHIHRQGGRFVTVIPHGRREDTWFRDWAQTHAPAWEEARRCAGRRQDDPDRVWRTFEAPTPSTDGYRVVWVHSTTKAARDAAGRAGRIEAGLAAIEKVADRLDRRRPGRPWSW